ncbi:kinase-like protein, partial [Eremomyces bilateralis CBS 781.70]
GSYSDRRYIAFIMQPAADTNLVDFLQQCTPAEYPTLSRLFGCLTSAIHYLHGKYVRHRDIFSQNVLVHNGEVKLTDFGNSYNWSTSNKRTTRDRIPINEEYAAPEVARGILKNEYSDLWSLGVVFLEMATTLLGKTKAEFDEFLRD